jgi:hypothetical protein
MNERGKAAVRAKTKRRRRRIERRAGPSEADVRRAALEAQDLGAAGEALGVADPAAMLEASPKLTAAWERGRFLRQVRQIAAKGIVAAEADRFFEPALERGELANRLKRDIMARDIWNRANAAAKQQARDGLMALARTGDRRAMELYERLLDVERRAGPPEAVNFRKLRPAQIENATGILHNQWSRWSREVGLPRNLDGSYDLPAVIEWLRRWERDSVTGGQTAAGLNPFQQEKARREKRENDLAEGRLVSGRWHIEELCRRTRLLHELLSEARAREWGHLMAGKTAEEIEAAVLAAFSAVLAEYKKLPADLLIPDDVRKKFEEGFAILEGNQ